MRFTTLLLSLAGTAASFAARAQVGVGTASPDAKSALDIRATDKGLLIPRLTASQRTGITNPPQGLMVYQTDGTASGGTQTGFWYYAGTGGWVYLDAANSGSSGLTLPFSGSYGGSTINALDVSHTNGGVALRGSAPNSGVGVYGASSTGSGVYGTASGSGGYGVRGAATAANSAGLYGTATGSNTYGVIGDGQTGVQGQGNTGPGLSGVSSTGPALLAAKSSGQTGRAAELTLTGTGNDSTALFVSSVAPRPALRAVNSNASAQAALRGVKTAGTNGIGVEGVVTSGGGNATGVLGRDLSGTSAGSGVVGLTTTGFGVQGRATGSNGWGVYGQGTDSYGVNGTSTSGVGTFGSSTSGYGVQGQSTSSYGVQGSSANSSGVYGSTSANSNAIAGVVGVGTAGGNSVGVLGSTASGYGVRGVATASGGYGVSGTATDSYGVIGTSASGNGVYGSSDSDSGVRGISTSGSGVAGSSTSGFGVGGSSTNSSGVYGLTSAGGATGVAGVRGVGSGNGTGVLGTTSSGYGVRGEASSGNGTAVMGVASGSAFSGVYGQASSTANGVTGEAFGTGRAGYFTQSNSSSSANALEVQSSGTGNALLLNKTNTSATTEALKVQNAGLGSTATIAQTNTSSEASVLQLVRNGTSTSSDYTIQIVDAGGGGSIGFKDVGASSNSATIKATNATLAGSQIGALTFRNLLTDGFLHPALICGAMIQGGVPTVSGSMFGRWVLNGDLNVQGNLSKFGGSFKIDHPLDPENQYLYHSFVESPDMMNVYNGNVTLDARGEATVQLPDYFEALNRDFRYQLTPIGAPFTPYVLAEVAGNKFRIAGQAGGKVSWQVTGIRQDKWAETHRIPNAVPKEPENRGKYLSPDSFGQPAARGIGYEPAEPAPTARR